MIVVRTHEWAEQALTTGEIGCPHPGCGGTLTRWGYGRRRRVRSLGVQTIEVRPRRARCTLCVGTQILLPANMQPRLTDTTEVIGAALASKAAGHGHRRIAAALDRPPATVRRWLRRATGPAHLDWLCVRGGTDGQVLTLELGQPMLITALSITPGWVGTDAGGVDQWPSHRVVSRVQWIFDNDPTTVMTQRTGNIRGEAVQPVPGRGVLASTITMIVLQTSRPPLDVAPTETAGGGGLLGGVLPPVPTETFPAPRFGAADTRPDPVDSTFAVSSIKVLGHTPE